MARWDFEVGENSKLAFFFKFWNSIIWFKNFLLSFCTESWLQGNRSQHGVHSVQGACARVSARAHRRRQPGGENWRSLSTSTTPWSFTGSWRGAGDRQGCGRDTRYKHRSQKYQQLHWSSQNFWDTLALAIFCVSDICGFQGNFFQLWNFFLVNY